MLRRCRGEMSDQNAPPVASEASDAGWERCAPVEPLLTIAIPTYNRPDLLRRALGSATEVQPARARAVEVVVSDNSTDDRTALTCKDLLEHWAGSVRYTHNRPSIGAEPNFNRCLELSRGRYVLILHDDDYLLAGAVDKVLDAIERHSDAEVLLFGAHVVDQDERIRRKQAHKRDRYLPPRQALAAVLRNSSYIRFPAIVVRRRAYSAVGPFDVGLVNPTDFDMWARLLARFGVQLVNATTCAYTVHSGALTSTSGMFNALTVTRITTIFERAATGSVLPPDQVRRHQRDFLHQFILGGAYRELRAGKRDRARQILQLFEHRDVRPLGLSPRWAAVRIAFWALTLGAPAVDDAPAD